jgi:transcriptional regulator with XRE-family HTH domain
VKTTKPAKTRQPKVGAKVLRDEAVIAMRLSGEKTAAIARKFGITRQTVSEILNSKTAEERIEKIDRELMRGLAAAIVTVLRAVKFDYKAARDLLRNFGAMRQKIELKHGGKVTLAELVAGSWKEEEDDET